MPQTHDPVKQRIIEHARDRFFSGGFSKVTIDELAEELGISKKTIYQHFQSKDELIDRVVDGQLSENAAKIDAIVNAPDEFMEKLYALWIAVGRLACRISGSVLADLRKHRPDLWKRIDDMRKKVMLRNITRMIDEGIARGSVRVDVHKEVIILMYLSSIQGVVNPDVLAESSFSAEEALKSILTVFFEGILTDRARKEFHTMVSHQKVTRVL
jgi:AcrR family transcriptional regulator